MSTSIPIRRPLRRSPSSLATTLVLTLAFSSALSATPASAGETSAPKGEMMQKSNSPGLIGNKLPRCEEGYYVADMICKAAPPGYYVGLRDKYPVPCPPGTHSPAGSKSAAYCKIEVTRR